MMSYQQQQQYTDQQQQHHHYHAQHEHYDQEYDYEDEEDWGDDFDTDDEHIDDYNYQQEHNQPAYQYNEEVSQYNQQDEDIYDMPDPDEVAKVGPYSPSSDPAGTVNLPPKRNNPPVNNIINQQQVSQRRDYSNPPPPNPNPPKFPQNKPKPNPQPPQQHHQQKQQQQQQHHQQRQQQQQQQLEKLQQQRKQQQESQKEEHPPVSVINRKAMFESSNWTKQLGAGESDRSSSKFGPRPPPKLSQKPQMFQRPIDKNNNNNNNRKTIQPQQQQMQPQQQEIQRQPPRQEIQRQPPRQEVKRQPPRQEVQRQPPRQEIQRQPQHQEEEFYEVTDTGYHDTNGHADDSTEEMYIMPHESNQPLATTSNVPTVEEDLYEVNEEIDNPPPLPKTNKPVVSRNEFFKGQQQLPTRQKKPLPSTSNVITVEEDLYEVNEETDNPPPLPKTKKPALSGNEFFKGLQQLSKRQKKPNAHPPFPKEGRQKPSPQPPPQQQLVEEETYEVCDSSNDQKQAPSLPPDTLRRRSNTPSVPPVQESVRNHNRNRPLPVPDVEEQEDYEVVTHPQTPQLPSRARPSPTTHPSPITRPIPIEPTDNSDAEDEEDYLIPDADQLTNVSGISKRPNLPAREGPPIIHSEPPPPPRNSLQTPSLGAIPPIDRHHKPRGSEGTCLSPAVRERLERNIVTNGWLSGVEFQQENINNDVMRMRSKLSNQLNHNGPPAPIPQSEGNKTPSKRPSLPMSGSSRPGTRPLNIPASSSSGFPVLSLEEIVGNQKLSADKTAPPLPKPMMKSTTLPARAFSPISAQPSRSQSMNQGSPSSSTLSHYSWYKKDMQRKDSEAILRNHNIEGGFIVRNASQGVGYSISIFHDNIIRNLKLNEKDGKYHLGSSQQGFNNIPELVSYHQNNVIEINKGGKVKLKVITE